MKPRTKKQIKNGLRLGLGMGLFLVAGGTLSLVFERLNDAAQGQFRFWPDTVIAAMLVVLASAILVVTARVWILYIAGCLLWALPKCLVVIATGKNVFSSKPISGSLAAELVLFSLLSLFLIYRITVRHRPGITDRLAFTFFTFALFFGLSRDSLWFVVGWHFAGLTVLCIVWLFSIKKSRKPAVAS